MPAAAAASVQDALQDALQGVLDQYAAKKPTAAFQLGFKNAEVQFGLAAGQYWKPGTAGYQPATLEDKFLYGSGTKPLTATAVMSLVESGQVGFDDKLEDHVDRVLDKLEAGMSMNSLFGANGSKVTVGQVLRMSSGINDFDWPTFDQELLLPPATYETHDPLETIKYVATQLKPGACPDGYVCEPFVCEPGTCVAYSSTNYVLAGLVLAAHTDTLDWSQMNTWDFYPESLRNDMPSALFYSTEMINDVLTLPGFAAGGWGGYPNTTIWNQSSTILGWTCGNLVASAVDNAVFFWQLLGNEGQILKVETVEAMRNVVPLNNGWAAGKRSYGTGLMMVQASRYATTPPVWGEWGTYLGHGGDTYGFLSEQGLVWGLNASLTVVTNHDSPSIGTLYCDLIYAAAQVLVGGDAGPKCHKTEDVVA